MKLFFREYVSGNSFPGKLIILHGLFGSSDNWHTIATQLSQTINVYVPDLRNHGRSPHAKYMDIKSMAEDILETFLLDGNTVLLGHSLGGKIVLHILSRGIVGIRGAIIADVSMKSYIENYRTFEGYIRKWMQIPLSMVKTFAELNRIMDMNGFSQEEKAIISKNVMRDGDHLKWKVPLDIFLENLKNLFVDIEFPLGGCGTPLLLLYGEKSNYVSAADIDQYKKIFRNFYCVGIEGAGHWLHYDNPNSFIREVDNFIYRLWRA